MKSAREIARVIKPLGWKVVGTTNNGHLRVAHENGTRRVVGAKVGDPRTILNIIATLRKAR